MSDEALIAAVTATVGSEHPDVLRRLAEHLDRGTLGAEATSARLQSILQLPVGRIEPLRRMLAAGRGHGPGEIALLLQMALAVDSRVRAEACTVEVAATHPRLLPRTRTTGGVARDIIRAAGERLLVVGYRATTDPQLTGLASQTLKAIAAAAARGVMVTAVLQREESNRRALQRAWPDVQRRAALYTWPEQRGDQMASLHAKVLVGDRNDALVTSANLTYHGFHGNVEMGVRICGKPATDVAEVFEELIRAGEFVPWPCD